MLIFETLKKNKINKKKVDSLCKLKNTFWKFGISSNKKWFYKNVKANDLNLFLTKNGSLIGYTLLRKGLINKIKKKIFFLFRYHNNLKEIKK